MKKETRKKKNNLKETTKYIKRNPDVKIKVTFLQEPGPELRIVINQRNKFCLSALMFTDLGSRKASKDLPMKNGGG